MSTIRFFFFCFSCSSYSSLNSPTLRMNCSHIPPFYLKKKCFEQRHATARIACRVALIFFSVTSSAASFVENETLNEVLIV
jgi:hypothetical protein